MAGKKLITNLLGSAVDALGNKIGALPNADLLDNLFFLIQFYLGHLE